MRITAILIAALVILFSGSAHGANDDNARDEFATSIVLGENTSVGGRTWNVVNKFGQNPDIDTAADEDVWDCPELGADALYPFLTTASTLYVSSDSDADAAATTIDVVGLDANWDLQTETVTLGSDAGFGTTSVIVGAASDWIRVTSVRNSGGTATAGNVYVHDGADAGGDGIPDDLSDVRGCFLIAHQRSEMSIYSVPRNYVGIIRNWTYGITPASTGATKAIDFHMRVREFGGVFQVRNVRGLLTTGTSLVVEATPLGIMLPAKSDIAIRGLNASANDVNAFWSFDVVTVPR